MDLVHWISSRIVKTFIACAIREGVYSQLFQAHFCFDAFRRGLTGVVVSFTSSVLTPIEKEI